MNPAELIQGSLEWLAFRAGKVTGSRIDDVMAKTKSGPSASRNAYMGQLTAEKQTGKPIVSYSNQVMQQGTEREPIARLAYCVERNVEVQQIGFVLHPTIPDAGSSPDGLVWMPGVIEIKCPQPAAHSDVLLTDKIPQKYIYQMQWAMACMPDREWCDFISFNPDFDESMQLYIQRVYRDNELINSIEKEVRIFIQELDNKVQALNTKYKLKATLEAAE